MRLFLTIVNIAFIDDTKFSRDFSERTESYCAETIYQEFSRSISNDPEYDYIYFAEVCAKRVCGKHNKNVIITILGKQGDGKSNAALNIAISAAKGSLKLKGGALQITFL